MAKYKMSKSSGAKKVSGTRKSHKKGRRRVGAASGGWMQVIEFGAGVAVGVIGGRMTANLIGSIIPSQQGNPMVTGAIQGAGGIFLAKEVKESFVKAIGFGLAANGLTTVIVSTGIIAGPNDGPMVYRLNGVQPQRKVGNLKFVAGPTSRIGTNGNSNLPMISGLVK